jgi:hypothetical protein
VGYVVDKVALGQAFIVVFWLSPVSIVPPLLHIQSSIIWPMDKGLVSGAVPQKQSDPIATIKNINTVHKDY